MRGELEGKWALSLGTLMRAGGCYCAMNSGGRWRTVEKISTVWLHCFARAGS